MWASRQTTERSFLHAEAHGPVPRRQTTGSHATAPAVFGPWGRFSKVRVGTARVASPAFETPRRSAPVFADASGAAGRRAIRARNLPSHRSSLRRPRGAASYAPNLSCHTLPLRAETHKYTTYRSCNGRQPQPIPARRIQQCSGSTCCWGSRRGRRRSSRHDPRRCTRRPRRRGRHSSRRAAARSRGRRGAPRGATLVSSRSTATAAASKSNAPTAPPNTSETATTAPPGVCEIVLMPLQGETCGGSSCPSLLMKNTYLIRDGAASNVYCQQQ